MRDSRLVAHSQQMLYSFVRCKGSTVRLGIVTGDLRRVQCADIWVNSENTDMRMARFEEFSVSAIIRFDGASKDVTGRVVGDQIAEQLAAKVADRTPVPPGTVITTGAGELGRTNRVRYIIHVAAVHGEPGKGYRQVLDVGRCVTNTLMEAQRLAVEDSRVRAILFPLLGTGVGGGQLAATVTAMVGATIDYFVAQPTTLIQTVYLLAYTETEFETCRTILDAQPKLFEATTSPDAHNSEDAL
jgi:O-acetyl-ADP-ribose deacetylase (regulator of RNase III)